MKSAVSALGASSSLRDRTHGVAPLAFISGAWVSLLITEVTSKELFVRSWVRPSATWNEMLGGGKEHGQTSYFSEAADYHYISRTACSLLVTRVLMFGIRRKGLLRGSGWVILIFESISRCHGRS